MSTLSKLAASGIEWQGTFKGDTDYNGYPRPKRNRGDPQIVLQKRDHGGISVTFTWKKRKSITKTLQKEHVKKYLVDFFISGRRDGWESKFPESKKKVAVPVPVPVAALAKPVPVAALAKPVPVPVAAALLGSVEVTGIATLESAYALRLLGAADGRLQAAKAATGTPVAAFAKPAEPEAPAATTGLDPPAVAMAVAMAAPMAVPLADLMENANADLMENANAYNQSMEAYASAQKRQRHC